MSGRQTVPGGQTLYLIKDAYFRERGPYVSNIHFLNPGFIEFLFSYSTKTAYCSCSCEDSISSCHSTKSLDQSNLTASLEKTRNSLKLITPSFPWIPQESTDRPCEVHTHIRPLQHRAGDWDEIPSNSPGSTKL